MTSPRPQPDPTSDLNELIQLELATAHTLPPGTQLNAETARLREGYTALTQLLAAADTLANPLPEIQLSTSVARPLRDRRSGYGSVVAWCCGATALALLLAIGAWQLWPSGDSTPPLVKDAPKTFVLPKIAGDPTPKVTPPSPVRNNAANANPALAWDDPLDSQVLAASEQLRQVGQTSFGYSAAYATFNSQLERIDQELFTEPL